MKWKFYFVVFLIIVLGVFYYNLTGNAVYSRQQVFVSRIVDGDTVEFEGGIKARLLGINAPEKGMLYSNETTDFLRSLVENKTVEVESFGGDKYGRVLVYIFVNGKNVNKEILGNGLGSLYYYEKDDYYDELRKAEEFARLNEKGIWEKSLDEGCIRLIELKTNELEKLVLENICDFDIQVVIKDDATHIYSENLTAESIFEKEFSHIWNDEGDSLYVWDRKGLLVFYRY